MGNVVRFSAKEPLIWVCNCGCSTFELLDSGIASCAACGSVADVDGSGWSSWTAVSRHSEDEAFTDIQGNGSVEFAKRRVARLAQDDDVSVLVVIRSDGGLTVWSAAETQDQIEWVKRKISQASNLIGRKEPS